jgi:hypothetical protein
MSNPPTPTEAAWAAGFLDGEGHFTIALTHKGTNFRAIISASQTTSEPLLLLQHWFGGSIRVYTDKVKAHKPCYEWTVVGVGLASLLEAITPYLIVKKRHADLILQFKKLVDASVERRSREGKRSRAEVVIEEMRLRVEVFCAVKELNMRGTRE